jgi:hypothetical protein
VIDSQAGTVRRLDKIRLFRLLDGRRGFEW